MSKNTYSSVHQAIQNIISKGGEALYQSYLNQKLPNDCNQTMMNKIHQKFNAMFYQKPIKNSISIQKMPQPIYSDKIMPHKVVVRSKSELGINQKADNIFCNTQVPASTDNSCVQQNIKSSKPNFCIKFGCFKGEQDKQTEQIRVQKFQNERQNIKSARQSKMSEQKSSSRRDNLQRKIKQLLKQGIPYTYDNDGNIQIPDIKQFKKTIQKGQQPYKNKNTFTLRVKALQLLTGGSQISQNEKDVKTKKKGFYSMKNDNGIRKRVSEQQFNNRYQRQYSSIPFMDVSDGVKIVQKQKNIMAHKIRTNNSHKTRNQFLAESRNTIFKSFLPTSQYSSVRASSAQRPMTSFTHRKNGTSSGIASAINLGLRPRSSKSRIIVYSKQQAINLVKY